MEAETLFEDYRLNCFARVPDALDSEEADRAEDAAEWFRERLHDLAMQANDRFRKDAIRFELCA